jgi:hypothetical protein
MNYFERGRNCGVPGAGRPLDPHSKAGKKRAEARSAEVEKEKMAFDNFFNSQSGDFNGFEFVNLFHENFKKEDAIYICEADDVATARTPFGDFETGADGITCYFYTKSPKKTVTFNRSKYFF